MVATIRGQMKLGVYEMGAEIFNKGWAAPLSHPKTIPVMIELK